MILEHIIIYCSQLILQILGCSFHCVHFMENTLLFCFILLRGHIGRSIRNSNPVMTLSAGGTKGCLDHRFCSPSTPQVYTTHLLTLHQHRDNNLCWSKTFELKGASLSSLTKCLKQRGQNSPSNHF